MSGFMLGFLLGIGFAFLGLIYFIARPVVTEYLRNRLDARLNELDEEDEKK